MESGIQEQPQALSQEESKTHNKGFFSLFDKDREKDSFQKYMPEAIPFPGPTPKHFQSVKDNCEYLISMNKYNRYQEQLSKETKIYEPTSIFLSSIDIDKGTGKNVAEDKRDEMKKQASFSMKLTLNGLFNFDVNDIVLFEIPEWQRMYYYAGLGRIVSSVAQLRTATVQKVTIVQIKVTREDNDNGGMEFISREKHVKLGQNLTVGSIPQLRFQLKADILYFKIMEKALQRHLESQQQDSDIIEDSDLECKQYYKESLYQQNLGQYPRQLKAVKNALTQKLTIVQGPPVTGKTSVLSTIVYSWNRKWPNDKIIVCAPSHQELSVCAQHLYWTTHLSDQILFLIPDESQEWLTFDESEELEYDIRYKMLIDNAEETKFKELWQERQALYNSYLENERALQSLGLKSCISIKNLEEMNGSLFGAKSTFEYFRQILQHKIISEHAIICITCDSIFNDFIQKYCMTLLKLNTKQQNASQSKFRVIIDGADRAIQAERLVPLQHAEQIVLLGNHKLLGPLAFKEFKQAADQIDFQDQIFQRLIKEAERDQNIFVPIFLDEQQRIHPYLKSISNQLFQHGRMKYGGKYIDRGIFIDNEKPIIFIDIDGQEEGTDPNYHNKKEGNAVKEIIQLLFDPAGQCKFPDIFHIITPYCGQVEYLKKDQYWKELDIDNQIDTIDSFQGSSSELIIFSTVKSKDLGLCSDEQLLNVALTRATSGMIIIGNSQCLCRDAKWLELIEKLIDDQRFALGVEQAASFFQKCKQ